VEGVGTEGEICVRCFGEHRVGSVGGGIFVVLNLSLDSIAWVMCNRHRGG